MSIDIGRLKHLEIIQQVVTRMANNSFLVKGWSVVLLSAILTLAVKEKVYEMALVALLPYSMFWLLDGYFLRQERLYRKLWNQKASENQEIATDFSMNTASYKGQVPSWIGTMFSPTLFVFYGTLLGVLILASLISFRAHP